jgi:hypothetical protein
MRKLIFKKTLGFILVSALVLNTGLVFAGEVESDIEPLFSTEANDYFGSEEEAYGAAEVETEYDELNNEDVLTEEVLQQEPEEVTGEIDEPSEAPDEAEDTEETDEILPDNFIYLKN